MTPSELDAFLVSRMPHVSEGMKVLDVDGMTTTVELEVLERHLRPGGTVSGPSLFMLADVGFYLNLMSVIGPVPLAVTTNASINFMRKPDSKALVAVSQIMKLGRQLVVGDVTIYSAGDGSRSDPVAHATMTYAIPPGRGGAGGTG